MRGAVPDPQQVKRLVKLYEDADAEITRQLHLATARGNSTAHLQAVSDNIKAILADLDSGSHTWTAQAVPDAYMTGVAAADKQLASLVPRADFAGVHTQAAQIYADNAYATLSQVSTVVGRQADDYLRAVALDAIRSPLIGGKDTAASDIFTRLADTGLIRTRADGSTYLGMQVSPGGKWWDLRAYSEMTARTTLSQTQRAGGDVRMAEAGIEMFIVVGGEGESVCDICQELMDNGPYTREEADAIEWHPNCTHSLAADPSELERLAAES